MKRYVCIECKKEWNQDQLPKILNEDKTKWIKVCPICMLKVKEIKIK